MAGKRGPYSTRQQEAVTTLMRSRAGESLTVDQIVSDLARSGSMVGKTTVYRSLERLASEGVVVQVPDGQGGPARYCLVEGSPEGTCLACLGCHRVFPLDCEGLETFVDHVSEEHGFTVEPHRTVLYGYCDACSKGRATDAPRA